MEKIEELKEQMQKDVLNSIYKEKKLVFGEGSFQAKLFMIGEAPGGEEEKQGHPFVGKAGKNLNEFLEIVGLKRGDIYISNVVKLRPITINTKTGRTVNRAPNKKEIQFFLPYLKKELELIQPSLIVTLGNVPLKAIMEDDTLSIGNVHGTILKIQDKKVFPLYHPASIIYNLDLKETYYEDLNKLKQQLLCI